ncbi:snake venom 5'-nucleotidase-like isoform X2 [Onthophagus taurus]
MSVGLHEFDDTIKNLTKFVESSKFPLLSCNTKYPTSALNSKVKSWVTFTVDSIQIGVIGVTLKLAEKHASAGGSVFYNEIDSIRRHANNLEDKGVQIIIALTNVGYEHDLKIADYLDNIDIIIGGTTNTFLYTGDPPDSEKPADTYPKIVRKSSGKKVLILQAYAYGKYLGVLNLKVSNKGEIIDYSGNPILLSSDIQKDEEVEKLIQQYKKEIESVTNTIIGEAINELSRQKCRSEECNLGNLLTDSFIDYVRDYYPANSYWSNCAIAFVNSGSIKKVIPSGKVSIGHVYESVPYCEPLVLIDVTWQVLLGALEVGFGGVVDDKHGQFLQVAGLIVKVDKTRRSGSRIIDVQARCQKCISPKYEPLGLESSYKVVTNRYLAYGGDGQDELKSFKRNEKMFDLNDNQAIITYFRKYNSVDVDVEGRIIFVNCGIKMIFNRFIINLTLLLSSLFY